MPKRVNQQSRRWRGLGFVPGPALAKVHFLAK
jgi:hypothetical protein